MERADAEPGEGDQGDVADEAQQVSGATDRDRGDVEDDDDRDQLNSNFASVRGNRRSTARSLTGDRAEGTRLARFTPA